MPAFRQPTAIAWAAAAVMAAAAVPAGAAITSSGAVGPDPSSGTVAGRLNIGSGNLGQVQVNGGSVLGLGQLGLGDGGTGNGSLLLSGLGTQVNVAGVNTGGLGNFDLGGWGTGRVSVLAGAAFVHGVNTADCLANCRIFIGNAAGSDGTLTVSGAGSSFNTWGRIILANGSAFGIATDGFDYGTPGAVTQGRINVTAGGTMSAALLTVGTAGGGLARTGTEQSFGTLLVDGASSTLNLVRNSALNGNASLLSIANGVNSTGVVDIKNGGALRLNGAVAPLVFSGVNVGSGGSTSSGTLRIDGAGSLLEMSGGLGFLNVGINVAGSTGVLQITGGGRVAGIGETGLAFTSVGRDGATGTLTVSGNDAAGNASTLRLAGRNPVTDGGAFLNIGGSFNSGKPGNGTANVLAGGRIEVDTSGVFTNTPTARTGMYVGVGQGASGSLLISGKSALTGAASTVAVTGGVGVTPFIGVGRDGATGNVNINGGGRWLISSTHASTTNANGDTVQLFIGDRSSGSDNPGTNASIGTVSVSGAGSELALTGVSDRYISVGNGTGSAAIGTLNVSSGAVVRSLSMLVGSGSSATGAVNVNGARIELGGTVTSGPAAGTGGSFSVGRSGGVGTANFSNGAVLQISTTTANASINAGGTGPAPGGVGTINVLSGSQLAVSGPIATLRVGGASSATAAGVGTLNIAGAGSGVTLAGTDARALIGSTAGTIGTVTVGLGASLSASSLIGVAHDGSNNTGGTGTLIVNGVAAAASIVNGSAGLIKGTGLLVGQVTNYGVINPGNSPGTLVIDGGFSNATGGQLVLEVGGDGHGGFITDRLVFTDTSTVDLSHLNVQFRFLGGVNPTAFQASGAFDTDSFFKTRAASGQDSNLADAAFGGVQFSATAQDYTISNFAFDASHGASFSATPVPEPATWALWLVGLVGLVAVGALKDRRQAGPC